MNSNLTYYCVSNIISSKEVVNHITSRLDNYIKQNNYDKACAFIKSLSLTKEHEKQLIKCVMSYKDNC